MDYSKVFQDKTDAQDDNYDMIAIKMILMIMPRILKLVNYVFESIGSYQVSYQGKMHILS